MNRTLSIISITLSIAALGMSIFTYSRATSPNLTRDEINTMIVAGIDARDHEGIAVLAPKAKAIYRDMLSPDKFNPDTFAPTTYEELLAPLVSIVNGLTAQP